VISGIEPDVASNWVILREKSKGGRNGPSYLLFKTQLTKRKDLMGKVKSAASGAVGRRLLVWIRP